MLTCIHSEEITQHRKMASEYMIDVVYSGVKKRRLFVDKKDIAMYMKLEGVVRKNIESVSKLPEICFQYQDGTEKITLSKNDEEVRFLLSTAEIKNDYHCITLIIHNGSSPQVSTV